LRCGCLDWELEEAREAPWHRIKRDFAFRMCKHRVSLSIALSLIFHPWQLEVSRYISLLVSGELHGPLRSP
jgi:hypothetical protein